MVATDVEPIADPGIAEECGRIVSALHAALGPDLLGAAVFGSWARGDADENSDIDLLLIAENLPGSVWERQARLREPLSQRSLRIPGFVALTPGEFLSRFPSLYLDFGLDAKILYDPTGSLDQWLDRIRQITDQAGLFRTGGRGQFFWRWRKRPRGNWTLTWEGLRELA